MGEQPAGDGSARQAEVSGRANFPAVEPSGAPRWVKVFAVLGVVVVALIVVMLLTGHGPGRHMRHGLGAQTGMSVGAAGVARW
jgi:hypothetical protein